MGCESGVSGAVPVPIPSTHPGARSASTKSSSSMPSDYNSARDELKAGFVAGKCSSLEFRRAQLAGIVKMLEDHVEEIATALAADMGRPKGEAEGEAWICIREAKEASANLKTWTTPEQKGVHVMFHPASAAVRRSPFGAVLIIGPYNYPLLLTIEPLIGAIAAGNATMLKPSELTPKVADFLERRLPAYVAREACQVVTGGVDVSKALLATKWDFIYFTGSPRVGQIVATAAAKFMTPTALELGGKAPVVVHESADLQVGSACLHLHRWLHGLHLHRWLPGAAGLRRRCLTGADANHRLLVCVAFAGGR